MRTKVDATFQDDQDSAFGDFEDGDTLDSSALNSSVCDSRFSSSSSIVSSISDLSEICDFNNDDSNDSGIDELKEYFEGSEHLVTSDIRNDKVDRDDMLNVNKCLGFHLYSSDRKFQNYVKTKTSVSSEAGNDLLSIILSTV